MADDAASCALVLKEQIEGRRRHRRSHTGTARDGARKNRFAGTQLTAQRKYGGCRDRAADLFAPGDQLRFIELERP